MPKTLIQKGTAFNSVYPYQPDSPQKNKVKTNGAFYHDRLNKAHQFLLDEKTMTDSVIGATNFLTAEIVFVIQTCAKRIAIGFPISTGDNIYNYQNISVSEEDFKNFLIEARTKTEEILEESNLKLDCSMKYIEQSPNYFCQKAYHTEKFFFHYLKEGGLETVVDLFPTKSITPETLVSIDAVELRMHSTRDMCHTCESLTIAEKDSLVTQLNELLVNKHYSELPENFKCEVIMSFNKQSSTRAGKLEEDIIDIRSKLLSVPELKSPTSYLDLHKYTCFTSGGSSQSDQNRRTTHTNAAAKTKKIAEKLTLKIETDAAKIIQNSFRRHIARRVISTLKSIYNFKLPLKILVFKKTSKFITTTALSVVKTLCEPIKIKSTKKQNKTKAPCKIIKASLTAKPITAKSVTQQADSKSNTPTKTIGRHAKG